LPGQDQDVEDVVDNRSFGRADILEQVERRTPALAQNDNLAVDSPLVGQSVERQHDTGYLELKSLLLRERRGILPFVLMASALLPSSFTS
jgi:hypothetical protein